MNLVSGASKLPDTYFRWRLKAPSFFSKLGVVVWVMHLFFLLANEANDRYESFIAPLLFNFLDQIGIENVGFAEKEKTGQNQKK